MTARYFLSLIMIGMGYMLIKESKKLSSSKSLISKTIEVISYFINFQLFWFLFEDIMHGFFKLTFTSVYYWIFSIAIILVIVICIVFLKIDLHSNIKFLTYSDSLKQILNTIDSIFKKNNINFIRKDFFGWANEGFEYTISDTDVKILLYESKSSEGYKINIKKFRKLSAKELIHDIEAATEELRDKTVVDRVKKKEKKDGLIMIIIGSAFMLAYLCIGIYYR